MHCRMQLDVLSCWWLTALHSAMVTTFRPAKIRLIRWSKFSWKCFSAGIFFFDLNWNERWRWGVLWRWGCWKWVSTLAAVRSGWKPNGVENSPNCPQQLIIFSYVRLLFAKASCQLSSFNDQKYFNKPSITARPNTKEVRDKDYFAVGKMKHSYFNAYFWFRYLKLGFSAFSWINTLISFSIKCCSTVYC